MGDVNHCGHPENIDEQDSANIDFADEVLRREHLFELDEKLFFDAVNVSDIVFGRVIIRLREQFDELAEGFDRCDDHFALFII